MDVKLEQSWKYQLDKEFKKNLISRNLQILLSMNIQTKQFILPQN